MLLYLTSMFTIVNKSLILEQMFIKKGFLAFLLGLCFTLLANTEHLNHASAHDHDTVYVLECEYAENLKTPKLLVNEPTIFTFLVEIFYLLNFDIHTTLLEKHFESRAPPKF